MIEEDKNRSDTLKFYINKRCDDLITNQKGMISSILERKHRKIVLDRVLVEKNGMKELIVDPEQIDEHINEHFQKVAGGINELKVLNNTWKRQYTPKENISERWYDSVMSPPTFDEWKRVLLDLPNGKAAGPSGISNEMLKHLGNEMHRKLWELIKVILVVNEIPNDWREAVIYPIPKPSEWECDLNKTRPITLLDTVHKALVKLVNQRLSHIISKRNILQGGNHAGLHLKMLKLAMKRIRLPLHVLTF
jgi:hypothetical protein